MFAALAVIPACNSDVPVSAVGEITPPGLHVTITRVATHPFLARFSLKLTVTAPNGCSATSELFLTRRRQPAQCLPRGNGPALCGGAV